MSIDVTPAWGTPDPPPLAPGVDPLRWSAMALAVRLHTTPGRTAYAINAVLNDARDIERYLRGEVRS